MSGQVIVITGANRGIGKGLLSTYIARPNTTVVAAVRDVAKSTKDLSSVTIGKDSKLIVVKVDSTVDSDSAAAVKELENQALHQQSRHLDLQRWPDGCHRSHSSDSCERSARAI